MFCSSLPKCLYRTRLLFATDLTLFVIVADVSFLLLTFSVCHIHSRKEMQKKTYIILRYTSSSLQSTRKKNKRAIRS